MKNFLGNTNKGRKNARGVSSYGFSTDLDNTPVCLLRGTFTLDELVALVDAMTLKNQSEFVMHDEITPSHS